jgi:CO dehydrogenase nickel-insertion accessory protein CooC1
MDQWLMQLLSEQAGFDLLTMGRPEGPQCYCYVNGLLRRYLKLLRDNYPCVVVDCEAGMEYLSRLTVDDVDILVMTAEPTGVGLATARRIAELSYQLPLRVGRRMLALNKVRSSLDDGPQPVSLVQGPGDLPSGVQTVVHVPYDSDLARRSCWGQPIDDSAGSTSREAVATLTRACLGLTSGPPVTLHKETVT